jgi:hypothetical protein
MREIAREVESLIERQLREWETARSNYAALRNVREKQIDVDGERYRAQFNPARIVSSAAKVDAATLKKRPCFLCAGNRPAEQEALQYGNYDILVNPFPIFPRHLTIADRSHKPQGIENRVDDMLDLARQLPDYTIFYNGPRCGASAPDHAHFQAGCRGFMPIEESHKRMSSRLLASTPQAKAELLSDLRSPIRITSTNFDEAKAMFNRILFGKGHTAPEEGKLPIAENGLPLPENGLPVPEGEYEPMVNILCNYTDGEWSILIFPRAKHRPSCYYAEGEANLLCSPASVDMGGAFIIPRESDFEKIDAGWIRQMLGEVCMKF